MEPKILAKLLDEIIAPIIKDVQELQDKVTGSDAERMAQMTDSLRVSNSLLWENSCNNLRGYLDQVGDAA